MDYKKIDAQDIAFLASVTDGSRVYTGEAISEDFSHDELGGIKKM